MRKTIALTLAGLACALGVNVSGASAANAKASCNGVLVSSLSGQPALWPT
ncbi:MAG TPA: hypothetical protein VFR38_05975 [Gaiellaceae bacterium]|nr:hypothetical protein [Gaiellaceae bacterium]